MKTRSWLADAVIPFADPLRRVHAKEQSPGRIDVVIFEIETLEPGIVPADPLLFHEGFEQPSLRDPIHASDERLGFIAERFQGEVPALEQPIGFFVEAAEMTA